MFSECQHAPRDAESIPARQEAMPYAVTVVSDCSALAHPDPTRRAGSVEPDLRHWAALIHEHTGLLTRPVYVAVQDAEDLSAGLRGLPPDVGVIVLIRTDPAHYSTLNGSAPGGESDRPVVTNADMIATAATAALLTTLNRRGLSPERSRVVIAGAATMPVLRPLLLAAGLGCVTSWDRRDAVTFPLRCITRNAEAVIDLLGCAQELAEAASDHPELIIITPDKTNWALLALPAVLHAVTTAQDPRAGVERYHSCALALAATPPDQQLPDPMEPALTSTVEQAATRAPGPARSSGEHTDVPIPRAPAPHGNTRQGDTR